MSDTVAADKVVLFHYTLTVGGKVVDTSRRSGEPLAYLHGAGNIVPGLERQLGGKAVGDQFVAVVPPEEGYGLKSGPGPQAVPRREFPREVREGMTFFAEASDGERVQIWVTQVAGAQVWVDTNHPLAGETLQFDIEVAAIRDANDDEKTHGHPHGPDGHSHHH